MENICNFGWGYTQKLRRHGLYRTKHPEDIDI